VSDPAGQPAASRRPGAAQLTSDQVWRELAKAFFAVVGHTTPAGEPRSSGVMYLATGRRLYVVVDKDSWKARHIAASGRVSVTVPVRRGGVLALWLPIPPATISFAASAVVHPAQAMETSPLRERLAPLLHKLAPVLPVERRASSAIIEICPEGHFVTYGIGVSLMTMRDTALARGRVPVS